MSIFVDQAAVFCGDKVFCFIKDNMEGLKELSMSGYSFIVISNQAGIARGAVSAAEVDTINRRMKDALQKININILGIYICPHHWDERCFCRKPQLGLFSGVQGFYVPA